MPHTSLIEPADCEPGVINPRRLAMALELDAQIRELRALELAPEREIARGLMALLDHGGLARLAYRNLHDYAVQRLGMSGRQAQELVQIERALVNLPCIASAYDGSCISKSHVRELIRVARPETDEALAELAGELSVRQLKVRLGHKEEKPAPVTRVRGEMPVKVADTWDEGVEMVRRMVGWTAPVAQCAELMMAELLTDWELEPFRDSDPVSSEPAPEPKNEQPDIEDQGPTPSPTPSAPVPYDPWAIDERIVAARNAIQSARADLMPLLRTMQQRCLFRELGYSRMRDYGRELGFSERTLRGLIERAGMVAYNEPLAEAYRTGRITEPQVELLSELVIPWTLDAWLAHAASVVALQFQRDAETVLRLLDRSRISMSQAVPPNPRQPCAPPEPDDADESETCTVGFTLTEELRPMWNEVRRTLNRYAGRRLCTGEVLGVLARYFIDTHAAEQRAFEKRHRAIARDGVRCLVPGCSARKNLHEHHIKYRSAGGLDILINIASICVFHHLRCIHEGIIILTGEAPFGLHWVIAPRPDGPPHLVVDVGVIEYDNAKALWVLR